MKFIILTLILSFSSSLMAGDIYLNTGDSISLDSNTIYCNGSSSTQVYVVSQVCSCEKGRLREYDLVLNIIMSDGSEKKTTIMKFDYPWDTSKNQQDCAKALKRSSSCN